MRAEEAAQVGLVPFYSAPSTTSLALYKAVQQNRRRVSLDFPAVARRYRTPLNAAGSFNQGARLMGSDRSKGRCVVMYGRTPIGMVTCEQDTLYKRRGWFKGRVLAKGPFVACWLLNAVNPATGDLVRPQNMLPTILEHLAQAITVEPAFSGSAWTVVRMEHQYVLGTLLQNNNLFGGFTVVGGPETFRRADGVGGSKRLLLVANRSIGDLRAGLSKQ